MLKYEITDILRTQMLNIRKELNLTSIQMGAIIGKSSSAYNAMENGTSNSIPHKLLVRMFKANKLAEDKKEFVDVDLEAMEVEGLSEFIIKKLDVLINTYSSEALQNEIWLQSLYMEHQIIKLDARIFDEIKKLYGTDNWTAIFSSLNKNSSIVRKFIYKEKNLPYVEKRTEDEKSKKDCPSWAVLYDLSEEAIDKMADDAVFGKINVAALFTLFLNHSVKNELVETNHYNKIAMYFAKNSIPLIFNKLGMTEKPVVEKILSSYLMDLMEYLRKTDIPQSDEVMWNLRNNILESHIMFASAISFNFSFVKDINDTQLMELRNVIENSIIEFRKKENI